MALPEDFNKIYGSTATGGLTPINDVNYAKGWEFVGSNPPTKNDFSYLQQVSDLKSQYLYQAIGGDSGAPAIGIPFFWPSVAMPNTVIPEWSHMVFLKFNNSTFSATAYPKLALVIPSLTLPDARGEFPRIWDDGRGVDSGRAILSAQSYAMQKITATLTTRPGVASATQNPASTMVEASGAISIAGLSGTTPYIPVSTVGSTGYGADVATFDSSKVVNTSTETRPRNIAFNFLVRAK